MILDCENYESTLDSILNLYDCGKQEIYALFDELNSVDIIGDCYSDDSRIYEEFQSRFGRHQPLTKVYWFHATRVSISTKFDDGLLPLSQSVPKIWKMFHKIFQSDVVVLDNLTLMQEHGVDNRLFNLKTKKKRLGGPYAMLIKDVVLNPEQVGNRDFLSRLPEIIEDICHGYKKQFDEDIEESVLDYLKPCIVKFSDKKKLKPYSIQAALNYIFVKYKGLKLSMFCVDNINCEGDVVLNEHITKIEFI